VAALALLAGGCGNAGKGKLYAVQAKRLTKQVELAQAAADSGNCNAARAAAAQGAQIAAGLQANVDQKLQNNLVSGFNHLNKRIGIDCGKQKRTTPTPSPTETPTQTVTQAPTATPTQATPTPSPTETATEAPTEVPTTAPTSTPTSALGGAHASP
jgi:hypothetical protein